MISRKVDPNEAPEWYYAAEPVWELSQATCAGCAFEAGGPLWKKCPDAGCTPGDRKDKCYVIFKKKEAQMQEEHMQQVNEQDAPTGFYAVHSEGSCNGCAFKYVDGFSCGSYPCNAGHREDGIYVVYKPKAHADLREAVDVIRWLVAEHKHTSLEVENFLRKYSEENNER